MIKSDNKNIFNYEFKKCDHLIICNEKSGPSRTVKAITILLFKE